MELSDYLRVLRKRWRLVLLFPLLTVAAAALITSQTTPQYQATVQFFISTPATTADTGTAYTGGLFSQQRVKSYSRLLSGPRLAQAVREDLGTAPTAAVRVSANAQPDTVLLTATTTDADPKRALAIAQAVGRVFPSLVDELEKPLDGGPSTIKAVVSAEAAVGSEPVSPRPVRNIALALVLGALLGVGVAVAREAMDNTIKTPEQLREIAELSMLGAIPFDSRAGKRPLVVQDDPRAPRAESFRQLRTNLRFVAIDRPLRSLVVTSPLPGEGKSTSACNLAITMAQSGVKVLLLEGDLRRPKVTDYLGIEGAVGLTSVLIGQATLDEAIQRWGKDGLSVLPTGPLPPNPSEMLASSGMRDLMQELESRYELVIVDAPPLLPVTDAAILATISTGVLFCIRSGAVRRDQARRAVEALAAVDAVMVGALFTMVPRRGPDSYGGYGYGYSYYSSDSTRPQMDRESAREARRLSVNGAFLDGPESSSAPPALPTLSEAPTPGAHAPRGRAKSAKPTASSIVRPTGQVRVIPPLPAEASSWDVAESALVELRQGNTEAGHDLDVAGSRYADDQEVSVVERGTSDEDARG